MSGMDSCFQLITEADFVLSKCGRFQPPVGSVVYIPKSFLIQAVLPVSSSQSFYKTITGDTTWCWRSVSVALSGNPPRVYGQVMKPDGKFLFNGLLDLTQIAGYGSHRYLLSKELECPPGSKIMLTLDDTFLGAVAAQPVSFLCGGAYAYYLKDGIRSRCTEDEASQLPRIFSGSNQNLLAPCWMSGEGPKIPAGFTGESFIYGNGISNVANILNTSAPTNQSASIQIDNDSDFILRRFLFDVRLAAGAVGTFMARIRAGSGYAFTDDYVDVAKYIGSAYLAKVWRIKAGDQISFDVVLVDGGGASVATLECFADGVKLRRVA